MLQKNHESEMDRKNNKRHNIQLNGQKQERDDPAECHKVENGPVWAHRQNGRRQETQTVMMFGVMDGKNKRGRPHKQRMGG